jgi:hypothetical protein
MRAAEERCMRSTRIVLPSALCVLALLSLSPHLARADEPSAAPPPAAAVSPSPQRWYGWQPLLVDAGSIAAMVGGGFAQGPAGDSTIVLGSAGAVFGSPVIHLAHKHPRKALISLGLRTLIPLGAACTGALIGEVVAPLNEDKWGVGWYEAMGVFVGGVSGGALAAAIDDVVVSREAVSAPPADVRSVDLRPTIEPRVSSVRGGATFGIGGTF